MKKLLLFIVAFLMLTVNVNAKNTEIEYGGVIPGVHLRRTMNGITTDKTMSKIIKKDTKELLYCIEPGAHIYTGTYNETAHYSVLYPVVDYEQFKYISFLSYYGYGYQDRTDIKWYIVTQYMIWDYLLKDKGEIYFIDDAGNKVNLYEEEIKAINKDMENRHILPSFTYDFDHLDHTKDYFKVRLNEEIVLEDTNNVLDDFTLNVYNNNVEARVEGNKVYVKGQNIGDTYLDFKKKTDVTRVTQYYYSATSQDLINRGLPDFQLGFTHGRTMKPSLTINKTDEEGKPLPNAEFEVYNALNDFLVASLKTNEEGVAYTEELDCEYCYYKETKAPLGYKLNPDKVYFNREYEDVTLNIANSRIYKNVNIIKYKESSNNKVVESNAIFEVYKDKALVKTIITDKNGAASLLLPYGTYTFKQITGEEGYYKASDFTITIDDAYEEKNYEVINKEITGNLTIKKIDSNTNEEIKSKVDFKILNTNTNEYLKINNSDVFTTETGLLELNNIPYGKYEIVEINPPLGYKVSSEKVTFTINEENTNIELNILNEPLKGNLKIKKVDSLTGEILANIHFGLYNKDRELIGEYITNEEGIITINDLDIGEYYVKELLTREDYELSSDEYKLDIKDGITSTITISNRKRIEVPLTSKNEVNLSLIIGLFVSIIGLKIKHEA